MKREPNGPGPLEHGAAMTPSARLAASHDALARYLGGSAAAATNGNSEGGQAAHNSTRGTTPSPAAAGPLSVNLVWALAHSTLAPLARDRPWTLVAGAAVVGALLATRPWRTVLRPLLVAGMVSPVITGWAMRSLMKNLTRRLLGPDPGQPR